MPKSGQPDPNAITAPVATGSTPTSPDIVNAINALTAFLRNGSQTPDPQKFNKEQQRIERDFRALLTGLGRGDRLGRLVRPVLSNGNLELGAALPEEAYEIGGYTRYRGKVWRVKVAEATRPPGTATHLKHQAIVTGDVVRLWVFDESGRPILIGFPDFKSAPVPGPTP